MIRLALLAQREMRRPSHTGEGLCAFAAFVLRAVHNRNMPAEQKFARPEFERRFLLAHLPDDVPITRVRHIVDRYIDSTTLRLRRQRDDDGSLRFKLTQKLPAGADGPLQGLITTIYLTEEEYDVLAKLPAHTLAKARLSLPPFGIDVFEGELKGLVMAEAEFASAEDAAALHLPKFLIREVTDDVRFTGGQLSRTTQRQLEERLTEVGIHLDVE